MKTLTVKIPEDLDLQLRRKAKERKESVSLIVREALAREVQSDAVDFAKLATPFLGMFSGPKDLSTREGYGSQDAR